MYLKQAYVFQWEMVSLGDFAGDFFAKFNNVATSKIESTDAALKWGWNLRLP